MDSSFIEIDAASLEDESPREAFGHYGSPSNLRSWPGSSAAPSVAQAPSVVPPESDPPPESDMSAMAHALAEDEIQESADDALAFEHIESFNILCVGESGLGKSTFLRDIFASAELRLELTLPIIQPAAGPLSLRLTRPGPTWRRHLDPTKQQEMQRRVAEQVSRASTLGPEHRASS